MAHQEESAEEEVDSLGVAKSCFATSAGARGLSFKDKTSQDNLGRQ
jgi:hypothetical protein